MSEHMNERISKSEWKVSVNKEQPFEWKGENSSEYLWNEDLYKAQTSGTPSDEQVGIQGKDGAGDIDREPKQLDLESSFNSAREMGSVSENPTVKPRMLNEKKKRGRGAKKIEEFSIKQEKKKPHTRPINTPKGIPVDLLNKAIDILSAPVDEIDVADDISVLLKNWQGSGYSADDNFEGTNWDPKERSLDNSVASVDPENKDLNEGEADEVDENLSDVLSDEASKAVVDLAKKNMRVAKKISNEAVEDAEEQTTNPDENLGKDNTVEHTAQPIRRKKKKKTVMDNVTIEKQLAMGHGRCPHKNQIDLCEKCGDMEIKQDDGSTPVPNGNDAVQLASMVMEKGTRNVTRKVRKNLEESAKDDIDDNLEESSHDANMVNLIKALEDVEVQLAVETSDYDGLMKALGSHIEKLNPDKECSCS